LQARASFGWLFLLKELALSCKEIPHCAFHKKYKDYPPAKTAFIDNACEKDWPCARLVWKKQTGVLPGEDFSPAGTYIKKNR
jgi:hypothetical protein